MKLCARCKEMVDVSLFPAHKPAADGLASYCRPCIRDFKKWYLGTPEGKAKRLAWNAKYRERNRVKDAAHRAVAKAIRSGMIFRQPCEACGAADAEAHHDDYGKPLGVRWLCDTHHKEWHRANKPIVPSHDQEQAA